MSNLGENIRSISDDDRFSFRLLSRQNEDELTSVVYATFFPHTEEFESGIPSLFISSLPKPQIINASPIVLLRDGALGIAAFFSNHPTPKEFTARLLIHKSLEFLIPNEWRSRINLYLVQENSAEMNLKKVDTLFIALFGDERFCSLDFLKNQIKKNRHILKDDSKIVILPSNNHPPKLGTSLAHRKNHVFDLIVALSKELREHNILTSSISTVSDSSLRNSTLLLPNQFHYHLSDDYVLHFLLSRGVTLLPHLNYTSSSVPMYRHQISFYHHYLLWDAVDKTASDFAENCFYEPLKHLPQIRAGSSSEPRQHPQPERVKIASDDFAHYVFMKAKKWFSLTQKEPHG